MLYLGAAETRTALPMSDAIDSMETAFTAESEAPLRSQVGSSLIMPGRVGPTVAVKMVSTVPGNPVGIVVVLDAEGRPAGLVDGPTLTAIRTGAVSGLATRVMADEGSSTLAMIGAGAMASDQIEAVRSVRPIERLLVWSRTEARARDLAERAGGEPVKRAGEAVRQADVVCCATPSRQPVFSDSDVLGTTHFNAVGSFTPQMAELPPDLVRRAFVVVDDAEAAAAEAGDLIQSGRVPDCTLSDVLSGWLVPKGTTTVFKSVGIAQQDVAAAQRALSNAAAQGLGTRLG